MCSKGMLLLIYKVFYLLYHDLKFHEVFFISFFQTVFQVHQDYPLTPPSVSAELEVRLIKERAANSSSYQRFLAEVKNIAWNGQFILVLLLLGSCEGGATVFQAKVNIYLKS